MPRVNMLDKSSTKLPSFKGYTSARTQSNNLQSKSVSKRFQRINMSLNDYFTPIASGKMKKDSESLNKFILKTRENSVPQRMLRRKKNQFVSKEEGLRHMNLTMRINKAAENMQVALWNGKTNKFTTSFQNLMFQDTRINSQKLKFTRQKNRKRSLEK